MQMQPVNKKLGNNVLKKYGQYTKRINGEIIKGILDDKKKNFSIFYKNLVVFEWYERENQKDLENISSPEYTNNKKHYRLEITANAFEQNKAKSSRIYTNTFSISLDFCFFRSNRF